MTSDENLNFNTVKISAMPVLELKSFTSIPFTNEDFESLTEFILIELEKDIQLSKENFIISKFKEKNGRQS